MADLFAWLISFFIVIALLGIILYQLMCLADLEYDYINPYDSASRINKAVLPEFVAEGVLCFLHLITGHWVMFLLCVPYAYYNVTFDALGVDDVVNLIYDGHGSRDGPQVGTFLVLGLDIDLTSGEYMDLKGIRKQDNLSLVWGINRRKYISNSR